MRGRLHTIEAVLVATVLKTSLSKEDEKELQEALHGQTATQ